MTDQIKPTPEGAESWRAEAKEKGYMDEQERIFDLDLAAEAADNEDASRTAIKKLEEKVKNTDFEARKAANRGDYKTARSLRNSNIDWNRPKLEKEKDLLPYVGDGVVSRKIEEDHAAAYKQEYSSVSNLDEAKQIEADILKEGRDLTESANSGSLSKEQWRELIEENSLRLAAIRDRAKDLKEAA